MAAMTGLGLAAGFSGMEDGAESRDGLRSSAEQQYEEEGGSSEQPDKPPQHPQVQAAQSYGQAYFHPRIISVFILTAAIPTIYVYLYVGGLWNPAARTGSVTVRILNLDAGVNVTQLVAAYALNATGIALLNQLLPAANLGLFLSSAVLSNPASSSLFDWRYYDSSNSSYATLADAESGVSKGDEAAWIIVVMPPAYTANYLQQAINVASLSQLNDDVLQLQQSGALPSSLQGNYSNSLYEVWDQGRSSGSQSLIQQVFQAAMLQLQQFFTSTVYSAVSASSPFNTQFLKAHFLLSSVPVVSVDTHPVPYSGMNFFSYLSGLVMWIGGIVTMTVVIKWSAAIDNRFLLRADAAAGNLDAIVGIVTRVAVAAIVTLIQAACVMSVIPALGGDPQHGNGALFVWIWYFGFCFVAVLGSLVALVGPDVFQIPATLWLILQLTSCGGIEDNVLQPAFYQVGLAFPLYYAVQGNRSLLFGSYYHLTEDALVLMGWGIGSLLVVLLAGRRRVGRRWDSIRDHPVTGVLADAVGFSSRPLPHGEYEVMNPAHAEKLQQEQTAAVKRPSSKAVTVPVTAADSDGKAVSVPVTAVTTAQPSEANGAVPPPLAAAQ